MTKLDTTNEIHRALSLTNTADTVEAIKRAVVKSIQAVDPRVDVETTDYFNHSFAPDIVLTWPHLSTRDERFVYLRFNQRPEWISDELPLLAKRHPLVYGLAPSAGVDQLDETRDLDDQSAEVETLITDPEGMSRLADVPHDGIGAYVSRTLVRGGRGLVDEHRATAVLGDISAGFNAARAADSKRTVLAASRAQRSLRASESARVVGFLQAMWVSSGHPLSSFPVSAKPATDVGNEALSYMLEHDEIADPDFWRALGRSISLERLSKLGVHGAPPNLQHFVAANLDRLWARACRVVQDQARLGDDHVLKWRVGSEGLSLGGSNFRAVLGASVDDVERVKPDAPSHGVSVGELRRRARDGAVDSLELTNGQRVVTYGSEDKTDVSGDDELSTVAQALGTAEVRRASVYVNARRLDIDFTTATVSARTSGRPPVTDLLGVGLPLVWPLTPSDLSSVDSMMRLAMAQQTLDLFPVPGATQDDDR